MADPTGAARRRRRTRSLLLTWAFLVLAIGLFAVFLLQANDFSGFEATAPAPETAAATGASADRKPPEQQVTVNRSAVSGYDAEQQPYSIAAESAVQDKDKPSDVIMTAVSGTMRKPDGRTFDLSARTARFDTKTKALGLSGQVELALQDRFRASMDEASVAVEQKALSSTSDVHVTFDGGEIRSTGIDISDNGARILFRSRVRATFNTPGAVAGAGGKESLAQ